MSRLHLGKFTGSEQVYAELIFDLDQGDAEAEPPVIGLGNLPPGVTAAALVHCLIDVHVMATAKVQAAKQYAAGSARAGAPVEDILAAMRDGGATNSLIGETRRQVTGRIDARKYWP